MIGDISAKEFVARVIGIEKDFFPKLMLKLPESGTYVRSFSIG
jgi:hypothetical protein